MEAALSKLGLLSFTKLEGVGNDFVLIQEDVSPVEAIQICDRHLGIGADQLLVLGRSKKADLKMGIFNSDGSIAEMCGNGIRAFALFAAGLDSKYAQGLSVETLAGVLKVDLTVLHREPAGRPVFGTARVEMGVPRTESIESIAFGTGEKFSFIPLDLGNPHAVAFVKAMPEDEVLKSLGPKVEVHPRFPNRTNVEWVKVLNREEIEVRVWERGAGLTLACGTGAVAAAVAAIHTGFVDPCVLVHLRGGGLKVTWAGPGQEAQLEGSARVVFSGQYLKVD